MTIPNVEKPVVGREGSRAPWRRLISGSTATAALTNPATTVTQPTTGAVATQTFPTCSFIFAGTDAADETVNYQVVGWTKYSRDPVVFWLPTLLAKGVFTLGSMAAGAAGADIDGSGTLFADTITETTGRAGNAIRAGADNTVATLTVDVFNSQLVEVQVDRDSAATSTVLYRLSERTEGYQDSPGEDLVFTRVKIAQGGAGNTVLAAAAAGLVGRLHEIVGTLAAAGTLTIEEADGTDLSGPISLAADGGLVYRFVRDREAAYQGAAGVGIGITTTGGAFNGHAIVSNGSP